MNNPILGTFFHAIGGASASSCYLPFQKTRQWSWESFWIVQSLFAWLLVPLLIGWVTIPDFFILLRNAPTTALNHAFLLGAVYGFGGMSFGYAIRHIGYSLTYSISIGLSAILGTLTPLLLKGDLSSYFVGTGAMIVLTGMILSVAGVFLCGWAGFKKEKDLGENKANFRMGAGLALAIAGGVLSAVFNISLEAGQPIADLAAQHGAGYFEGNAKLVVSTSGCFVVNWIWFGMAGWRKGTLKELLGKYSSEKTGSEIQNSTKPTTANYLWSMFAGTLWTGQFFFYGVGHVNMGPYQYISWVLHMSMLIFFSYIVGLIMKEWNAVQPSTFRLLLTALVLLFLASVTISYGSSL